MNLYRLAVGAGIASALFGCAANAPRSKVVYVPMSEWAEPASAKTAHPEPGMIAVPATNVKLTLHTPIKRRVSVSLPDCGKARGMATCYEEVQ